jgi:hypothetical protein
MRTLRGLRTAWALLCACALVAAALLPSASRSEAKAAPHGGGHGGNGYGLWAAQRPVSFKNLTIFPVRGRDAAGAESYITLDEGIKAGTVVITEQGAGTMARRPSRRGDRTQQVNMVSDGGASVNQLALVNRSGKKLLLLSGEVIVGGKQDRIVQEDRVVPPVSVPIALDVFCVEHGRWQQRASASVGNSAPVVAPSSEPRKAENFYSLGAVAHPKLRGAAQDKKQQSEVWKEVGENNARLGTANSTDTYQEVYSNKKVAGDMQEYIRALEREVLQPGVVGVVVARNGELVWADVFGSSSLFARYWPKLLKSYAVDAIGDYRNDRVPTVIHAQRYLNEREGAAAAAGQAGVYQLVKIENPRYAVFELRDISLRAPLRLHFNKMQR